MKNILLICLITSVLFGCKKEEIAPPTLIGAWQASDNSIQFVIQNIRNEGINVKYLEINNANGRLLQQTIFKEVKTYKIIALTKYELMVKDSVNNTVFMHKISDL